MDINRNEIATVKNTITGVLVIYDSKNSVSLEFVSDATCTIKGVKRFFIKIIKHNFNVVINHNRKTIVPATFFLNCSLNNLNKTHNTYEYVILKPIL